MAAARVGRSGPVSSIGGGTGPQDRPFRVKRNGGIHANGHGSTEGNSIDDSPYAAWQLAGRLARFREAQRYELTSTLLGLVQQQYPLDERAKTAFLVLRSISPDVAGDYLADLPLDPSWGEKITDRVLRDMAVCGNRRSFDRVQELRGQEGFIGERATFYLESLGYISLSKLEGIGRDFRKNPTGKLLNKLYSSYISHQINKPIEPILKLLGAPSKKVQHVYVYEVEGIQLYMEDDAEGRLVSLKLH